jgi:hypothetical protein
MDKFAIAGAVVTLTLVLAACSGSPEAADPTDAPPVTSATATPSPTPDDQVDEEPAVSGDCSAITEEHVTAYVFGSQIYLQVLTPDMVATATDGSLGAITLDDFAEALTVLQVVNGFEDPTYGSAADGLETMWAAHDGMVALTELDEVTQADVDAYTAQTGGVDGMFLALAAINSGLAEACPDVDLMG